MESSDASCVGCHQQGRRVLCDGIRDGIADANETEVEAGYAELTPPEISAALASAVICELAMLGVTKEQFLADLERMVETQGWNTEPLQVEPLRPVRGD